MPGSERQGNAPSPWVVLLVAGISGFVWQFVLIWLKRFLPAVTQGAWVALPMLLAIIMAVAVAWLVRRWAQSRNWGDLHLLALASGALIAHTVFGVLTLTVTMVDRVGLAMLGLVMIILLAWFAIRVRNRVSYQRATSEERDLGTAVPGTTR